MTMMMMVVFVVTVAIIVSLRRSGASDGNTCVRFRQAMGICELFTVGAHRGTVPVRKLTRWQNCQATDSDMQLLPFVLESRQWGIARF